MERTTDSDQSIIKSQKTTRTKYFQQNTNTPATKLIIANYNEYNHNAQESEKTNKKLINFIFVSTLFFLFLLTFVLLFFLLRPHFRY